MSLVDQVRLAGVVGAGGGGFSAHVKLGSKAEMNFAESFFAPAGTQLDQAQARPKRHENFRRFFTLQVKHNRAETLLFPCFTDFQWSRDPRHNGPRLSHSSPPHTPNQPSFFHRILDTVVETDNPVVVVVVGGIDIPRAVHGDTDRVIKLPAAGS